MPLVAALGREVLERLLQFFQRASAHGWTLPPRHGKP